MNQGGVLIGRMEIREEVLTRKEDETGEQELITAAKVQVIEVRSCFCV
jgi:hypothetical protein